MWDLVILTAGHKQQKETFEALLAELDLSQYCRAVRVVQDMPEDVRIGSGGAALEVIREIFSQGRPTTEKFYMLLIHSGGFSQRIPHLAPFGKVFAYLPGGITVLEGKLQHYQEFVLKLPYGLLTTASDVMEDVTKCFACYAYFPVSLFAHNSTPELAAQHGVFVMDDDGNLKSVLQKPSMDEIRAEALLPDGTVYTDSWQCCEELAELCLKLRPIRVELCTYGDFLRPLGTAPRVEYIEHAEGELQDARLALAGLFLGRNTQIGFLGKDSFFHFGTTDEFLCHVRHNSTFRQKFSITGSNVVFSGVAQSQVPDDSFIEFSKAERVVIRDNCIVSGIEATDVELERNSLTFTVPCQGAYVTFIFDIHDDIKKKQEKLVIKGKPINMTNVSLWEAKLFKFSKTRKESLICSLKNNFDGQENAVSLADAIRTHDREVDMQWRKDLRLQFPL